MTDPNMLNYALRTAEVLRAYVFPCEQGGKKPLVKWRDESTADPDKIAYFWRKWPNANIGLDCGKSGLYVVDADLPEGIAEWNTIADAGALHGQISQVTGGGGMQVFFNNPLQLHNTAKALAPHVDSRGFGGYVIIPPSLHPSGRRYSWIIPPGGARLIDFPAWLEPPKVTLQAPDLPIDAPILPAKAEQPGGGKWLKDAISRAGPGRRNAAGFWLACMLRDDGLTLQEAAPIMLAFQSAVAVSADHVYSWNEAKESLKSAYARSPREAARKGQLCRI